MNKGILVGACEVVPASFMGLLYHTLSQINLKEEKICITLQVTVCHQEESRQELKQKFKEGEEGERRRLLAV